MTAWMSTDGTNWSHLPSLDASITTDSAQQTQTWLSDEEMDSQNLSKRRVGGVIPLPESLQPILPKQSFYLRWDAGTDADSENITYGIDNIRGPEDRDGDGLSDSNELLFGTNPDDEDSDNDGMLDGEEVDYDTNPNDSSSHFELSLKQKLVSSPDGDSLGIQLEWPSANGCYYTVLHSETLTGEFTPVPGSERKQGTKGSLISFSHASQSQNGYYKIKVEKD